MRNLAQRVDREVTFKVAFDVSKHGIEAFGVGSRIIGHRAEAPGYAVDDRITQSGGSVPRDSPIKSAQLI
ncbi:putative uncharacterized protein [Pseudomonas sp. StFLB209]|nr:putative uncharacterized protein [Pseudomonas sp. StFLB209]